LDTSPPEPPPLPPPQLSALYQELILDHYRRPRNKGTLEQATHAVSLNNPLCGDEIDLQLRVDGDIIKEARFIGRGCSISQAAASMMTQLVKDKSIPQALALADRMSAMMQGDEGAGRAGQDARRAARPGGRVEVPRPHQVRTASLERADRRSQAVTGLD